MAKCISCGKTTYRGSGLCKGCEAPIATTERQERAVVRQMATGPDVCPACGFVGKGKSVTPGSTGIELLMWICFIIPGLIYSLWRISARGKACPSCGNRNLIPVGSPMGRKIVAEVQQTSTGWRPGTDPRA